VNASDRWLYGWGLGHATVGAASLAVPLYAIALDASALLVGLIASTAAFAGVPGAILWGKLASRTGRRRRFVVVALGATAGVVALLPVVSLPAFRRLVPPSVVPPAVAVLVLNAALMFVVAAAAPVLNLIVVEGVPADRWDERFGLLNHYQGFGWLGGLAAGFLWGVVGPAVLPVSELALQRVFFLVLATAAAVGLAIVVTYYPEQSTLSERRFLRRYTELPRRGLNAARYVRTVPFGPGRLYWAVRSIDVAEARRRFTPQLTRYLAAATLFFVGFAVFFGPLPAYLRTAGFGGDQIFALYVINSAGAAVLYARVGDIARRIGTGPLQTGALTARGVAFPLVTLSAGTLPFPFDLASLAVLLGLVGVTWAVISVTATGTVTRLSPAPIRGEALGLYAALAGFGGGVGAAIGGAVATVVGYFATFLAAGVVVVAGAGVALTAQR
jgi:MFS family permease